MCSYSCQAFPNLILNLVRLVSICGRKIWFSEFLSHSLCNLVIQSYCIYVYREDVWQVKPRQSWLPSIFVSRLNGSDERQQSGWIKAVGSWFESGQCVGALSVIDLFSSDPSTLARGEKLCIHPPCYIVKQIYGMDAPLSWAFGKMGLMWYTSVQTEVLLCCSSLIKFV